MIKEGEGEAMIAEFQAKLERDLEASNTYRPNKADWLEGAWAGLEAASGDERRGETAVPLETLREVGMTLTACPRASTRTARSSASSRPSGR